MPHLQIDINKSISEEQKQAIVSGFKQAFSSIMDTGTDHIATVIREHSTYALDIGRATDHAKGIAQVNADVRAGRSSEQRRELAVQFMQILHNECGIPVEQMYVTFTEHKGEDFNLSEKCLASWEEGDDPLAD